MSDNIQNQDLSEYKKQLYYDGSKALSYNAFVTASLGGRGVGKTFWHKERAINCDGQVIWVRRFDADVEDVCGTKNNPDKFTPDLYAEGKICEDDNIAMEGRTLFVDEFPKISFLALNTATRKKSASYASAQTIVFDEFLEMDTSKYLKDETIKFYELIETVNRLRLKEFGKRDVRVIMLANKVSFMNPYFADWGVTPFTERFKWFRDKTLLVENYHNELFEQKKAESAFGKLTQGTKYADYAIYNKSWDNEDAYIQTRPKDSEFLANVRYKERTIGLWMHNGRLYCSYKNNPARVTFADTYECTDDELPMRRAKPPISWLENYYNNGMLRFDDNIVKQTIFTIMQQAGTRR